MSNRIITTTQRYLMPRLVDTILDGNVGFTRIVSAAKSWRGEELEFPIKYQKGVSGTSFSGFDTLPTSASDTRVKLSYDPKFYAKNVALPMTEISINATKERVLNLMDIETASAAQDMADELGTIFYGDGTGNASKDPLGLGALVDDGSSVATIGGLSRSTYPTLQSVVTASGGTLSLAKMATLWNGVTSGSQKPTIGLTTEAIFSLYEQLLTPQERIAKDVSTMKNGMIGGTGFTGLFYKGLPILSDEKCTAGELLFLNEKYIDFYALPKFMNSTPINYKAGDIEGNDYKSMSGYGFHWGGWIQANNAAAVNGFIYFAGDFLTDNPKRSGKLTGLTSV